MTKMIKGFKPSNLDVKLGKCYLIDVGVVRGPTTENDQKVNTIANFDGFTLYLLITDQASRYDGYSFQRTILHQ